MKSKSVMKSEENESIRLSSIIKKLELFNTEIGGQVLLNVKNQKACCGIKSTKFKEYLKHEYYSNYNCFPSDRGITNITDYYSYEIGKQSISKLIKRIYQDDNCICYNLANKNEEYVYIPFDKEEEIEIRKNNKLPFLEGTPQQLSMADINVSNAKPKVWYKNILLLRKYINTSDDDFNLLICYIVSCFIPNIQHPILLVNGGYGTGKSFLAKIIKSILDGNRTVLSDTDTIENWALSISHSYYSIFDNLSKLSQKQSDFLCQVSTGGTIEKRTLYSNDEITKIDFTGLVALTSINELIKNPDIAQRLIVINTTYIDKYDKSDNQLWDSFEKDKPLILGAIFSILKFVMQYDKSNKNNIESQSNNAYKRLADFSRYGSYIYTILFISHKGICKDRDFDYYLNFNEQRQLAYSIDNDPMIKLFVDFVKHGKIIEESPSMVLALLKEFIEDEYDDIYYDKEKLLGIIPKDDARLGKWLNKNSTLLEQNNISINVNRDSNNCRHYEIKLKTV